MRIPLRPGELYNKLVNNKMIYKKLFCGLICRDLVWTKLPRFPPWAAKLRSLNKTSGNVSFFNWNGGDCTVNRSSLQPFDTGMEVKTSKKNDQSYKCFPTVSDRSNEPHLSLVLDGFTYPKFQFCVIWVM